MMAMQDEPHQQGATRQTYLAEERTLLAWWRSGLTALAVAIGVGRLVPVILDTNRAPFVALGLGFAVLGLAYVIVGTARDRVVSKALDEGSFVRLDQRVLWALTVLLALLAVATILLVATTAP